MCVSVESELSWGFIACWHIASPRTQYDSNGNFAVAPGKTTSLKNIRTNHCHIRLMLLIFFFCTNHSDLNHILLWFEPVGRHFVVDFATDRPHKCSGCDWILALELSSCMLIFSIPNRQRHTHTNQKSKITLFSHRDKFNNLMEICENFLKQTKHVYTTDDEQ